MQHNSLTSVLTLVWLQEHDEGSTGTQPQNEAVYGERSIIQLWSSYGSSHRLEIAARRRWVMRPSLLVWLKSYSIPAAAR